MRKYKLIVRCQLLMGRPVTDDDRKALNCYYETSAFYDNRNAEDVAIIIDAYGLLCEGNPIYRHAESVELISVT